MLKEIGVSIFTFDDWHEKIQKFPKTLMRVCSIVGIFKEIGTRAQDSLVGSIIDESETHAKMLAYLERINNEGSLSDRQQERFTDYISKLDIELISSSGLSTKICYENLIKSMGFHNWYTQNPAIDLIVSNGPEQVAELEDNKQVNLGRNLLQCADGQARSACRFLEKLSSDEGFWPFNFILGVTLELFINDNKKIRIKELHMNNIFSILNKRNDRDQIIEKIVAAVDEGAVKTWMEGNVFEKVIALLSPYTWAAPLVTSLNKAKQTADSCGLLIH